MQTFLLVFTTSAMLTFGISIFSFPLVLEDIFLMNNNNNIIITVVRGSNKMLKKQENYLVVLLFLCTPQL